MKTLIFTLIILSCATLSLAFNPLSIFKRDSNSPVPVDTLDLAKYSGLWYEIARTPFFFERKCYCSTAKYTLNNDGTVGVENSCNWKSPLGELNVAEGKASPVDDVKGTVTTGNLKVKIGWASSSYLVLDVDDDYQYALVGNPDRNHMWVLSRSPSLDEKIYYTLIDEAREQGYDVSKIIKTYQGPDCSNDDI